MKSSELDFRITAPPAEGGFAPRTDLADLGNTGKTIADTADLGRRANPLRESLRAVQELDNAVAEAARKRIELAKVFDAEMAKLVEKQKELLIFEKSGMATAAERLTVEREIGILTQKRAEAEAKITAEQKLNSRLALAGKVLGAGFIAGVVGRGAQAVGGALSQGATRIDELRAQGASGWQVAQEGLDAFSNSLRELPLGFGDAVKGMDQMRGGLYDLTRSLSEASGASDKQAEEIAHATMDAVRLAILPAAGALRQGLSIIPGVGKYYRDRDRESEAVSKQRLAAEIERSKAIDRINATLDAAKDASTKASDAARLRSSLLDARDIGGTGAELAALKISRDEEKRVLDQKIDDRRKYYATLRQQIARDGDASGQSAKETAQEQAAVTANENREIAALNQDRLSAERDFNFRLQAFRLEQVKIEQDAADGIVRAREDSANRIAAVESRRLRRSGNELEADKADARRTLQNQVDQTGAARAASEFAINPEDALKSWRALQKGSEDIKAAIAENTADLADATQRQSQRDIAAREKWNAELRGLSDERLSIEQDSLRAQGKAFDAEMKGIANTADKAISDAFRALREQPANVGQFIDRSVNALARATLDTQKAKQDEQDRVKARDVDVTSRLESVQDRRLQRAADAGSIAAKYMQEDIRVVREYRDIARSLEETIKRKDLTVEQRLQLRIEQGRLESDQRAELQTRQATREAEALRSAFSVRASSDPKAFAVAESVASRGAFDASQRNKQADIAEKTLKEMQANTKATKDLLAALKSLGTAGTFVLGTVRGLS